jgi:predicted nucleic acid-binding protein
MYLLDASVIAALRRPADNPEAVSWLKARRSEDLYLSAITVGELARGVAAETRRDPEAGRALAAWLGATMEMFSDRLVPFTPEAGRIWAKLGANLGADGPASDLLIAASALERDFTVVTRNVRDFAPTGVAVENPFV